MRSCAFCRSPSKFANRRGGGRLLRFIGNRMLIPRQTEATKLLLEGGFAQRASDTDVVWVYGYG